MPIQEIIKILFLAANPQDTTRLRIDEEMRAVDQALRMTKYRDRFDLRLHWAVRYNDLQELLLRHKPHIVHFSGHGIQPGELILQSEHGIHPVNAKALSALFAILKDNLHCVVLNACYSEVQANAIAEHIDCVIGMSGGVKDSTSMNFATTFYQALGYGKDLKSAFDLGCVQISENLDEQNKPIIIATNINPSRIFFLRNEKISYVPLIDREEVVELFHRLLDPFRTKRIIRLVGDPKMGKSHLLTKVFPILAHQYKTRCVILDLRSREQNIIRHLYNACGLLGDTHFKTFTEEYYAWLNQPQTSPSDLQSLLSSIAVWARKNKATTEDMVYRLTYCFINDLRQLDAYPLVLIFDTVNNATNATQKWLMDDLLVQLYQLPHVCIIIGGRTLPEASGTYASACYDYTLRPVEKVDAYIRYCQEVNANLPEQEIPNLAKVVAYTPGRFAEAIEARFPNRSIING